MATSNVLIPQDAADVLKCSLCGKYLSVPPVFTTNYGADKYRCGRCPQLSSESSITTRAKIYEKLAEFMLFPCINTGCKQNLVWGTVLDHENVCAFRTITCPSDDCEQDVEIQQLITHFDSHHMEYKKTDLLEVSDVSLNTENFTVFLLVKFRGKPFLFFQYTNIMYIWFSIFCFHEQDTNKIFDMKFVSKNNSFSICDQKVSLFNNREHCINCIMRLCNSKSHKNSKINAPYRNSIDVCDAIMTTRLENKTIKSILKSDSIDYSVNIRDDVPRPPAKKQKIKTRSSKKEEELKDKEETRENIDKTLMENIECPVCNTYMRSPIYFCQTGHSLCDTCLSKLQKCPFCQAKFVNSRNYALEKISEIFQITQPSHPKQRTSLFGNV